MFSARDRAGSPEIKDVVDEEGAIQGVSQEMAATECVF